MKEHCKCSYSSEYSMHITTIMTIQVLWEI